ncbi:MAG: helix-turn-helix domain-containing protein [Deltaproteobacteria bacterium]|nr:helix-turn-helix domain-containing protein [Deltaproteobacteria bacterium]
MAKLLPPAFREALRYLRVEKGLNQSDLAAMAEVGQSYISALERGDKEGSEETRRRVCQALGWPYEAVLDLAAAMAQGQEPARAAEMAFAVHDKTLPPPIQAMDMNRLRGFRVHYCGEMGDAMVWVDRRSLGGRGPAEIHAHHVGESRRVMALVDHADRAWAAGALFLCRPAPAGNQVPGRVGPGPGPVLRRAELFAGAVLLLGLEGEREAAAGPWEKMVLGRVIWYQVNLLLAEDQPVL